MTNPSAGPTQAYFTAKEAAAHLGISLPTLYAYVSRGLIRSEARSGHRSRLYRAEDVQALAQKKAPAEGGERALHWGMPVLDSAITLIGDDALYYRGRDAARLAAESPLEAVAALIWDCGDRDPFADPMPPPPDGVQRCREAVAHMRPVDRCQALLPVLAAGDPHVFNRTADGVRNTGARIMRWMAALIAGTDVQERPLHAVLADAWSVSGPGADLLRSAMVLCADHELNASTFTVRCVAATGASPYSAVVSGLAALTGPRHGGLTERAEALLDSLLTAADPIAQATELLRRGDEPCGFGHPLYPAGDPRARCLMDRMVAAMPDNATLDAGLALAEAISEQAGRAPTCDYALALLSRCLGLPAGAGLSVFALGRAAGWIGHALEQYAQNILIRPRARYTGVHP